MTMQIDFLPRRGDAPLTLERRGDTLIVNGDPFDFTELGEGHELPLEVVNTVWCAGNVKRFDGVLHLKVRLPFAADAPYGTVHADPITVTRDGPIALPPYTALETSNG